MSGPRLSITPAGAIFDRSLEPRDTHVLNLLGCYTDKNGWCRRSQVKMAKQLNCGRSSIQRSLDRLCEAGWVEKKRPPWSNAEGQPSNSYMYRVVLDRDDAISLDDDDGDDIESHAEDASQADDCPPVGTPEQPTDGHPGAQPRMGTGAQPYVGTKNDPLERPLLERERDARARAERTARFLVDFEHRWPSAAVDDRQRTAYAAESLTEEEQQAALGAIAAFLANLKRLKRTAVPAGWKYLEEKRWTLLEQAQASTNTAQTYARDSIEGKALMTLHDIGGVGEFFRHVNRRSEAGYFYRGAITDRIRALAQAPRPDAWVELNRQQAAAWESFLREHITANRQRKMVERSRAPWPWPPSADGKLYTSATGPPETYLSEEDYEHFR